MRIRKGLKIDAILTKLRVENGWTDCGAERVHALSGVASLSVSIANIDPSPAYWIVTPFAGTSERADMRIVLTVTTGAIGCDLKARRVLLAVTALTF